MSNLLEQASLVMIPSGYKEDVVYSEIPINGAGDLSFTRASDGTRINSQGLVEVVPWNLLEQSETFDSSTWSKTGVTVTANTTTAPNGTTTADTLVFGASSNEIVQSVGNLVVNETYTLTIYLRVASGTATMYWGNIDYTTPSITVTTEWQRFTVTQQAASTTRYPKLVSSSAVTVYAWGAQLNIGSTAKPYFPTTDRLNVPRLTYQNGGGGCPSLLLEKQSTNLVVQSNDMTTWTNGAGTMTKNATTSPDGTNNALSFDNTADCSTFVSASNGVHSWSLYVKQGTSAAAAIDMSDGSTGDAYASFTFSSKTFSTASSGSWSNLSTSYIECGNGWFRITLTATKNAGSSIGHKIVAIGSGYTYVYGAQLEASSYPTSYIPTTSSSATRVADASRTTGRSSLIGQSEGTLFLDLYYLPLQNQIRAMSITETSVPLTNRLIININNTNNRVSVISRQSGSLTNGSMGESSSTVLLNGRNKIALGYKSGDSVLYINGVQVATNTDSFTFSATLNDIFLMTSEISLVADNVGLVNISALFTTRLTNAELASITTL